MSFDGISALPRSVQPVQGRSPTTRLRAFPLARKVGLFNSPVFFLAASALVLMLLWGAYNSVNYDLEDGNADAAAIFLRGEEDLIDLFESLNASQRCFDDDDPLEWKNSGKIDDDDEEICDCPDPTVARKRGTIAWDKYHEYMVERAKQVQKKGLDVLFLGDSITERWMGTKAMGKAQKPEYRAVFEQHFRKSEGAVLDGEAFGTGGDTTTELLWHVEHGLLPKNIRPKAFLLLIGTNDLGIPMCSKKNGLAGILNVATYIHKQRPEAAIIVHGLTPRNELYGDKNFDLGPRWEQIKWINTHLQRYTALQEDWFYIENSEIFLRQDDPAYINKTLMADALHPTVEGYKLWAPLLSKQIQDILAMRGSH